MEPEDSLPNSQEHSACLYPEPAQSSTCPPFHFLRIHFNIILPSRPRHSNWSLSIRSPHHKPVRTSSVPHTCHMSRPSHSSWFASPNNIWWAVQINERYRSISGTDQWAVQINKRYRSISGTDQWAVQIIERYRSMSGTDQWAVQISKRYRWMSGIDQWAV